MSVMDGPKRPEDVKAELDGGDKQSGGGRDPKLSREYEFDLDYTGPTGRRYRGHFKNHILTIGEHAQVSFMRSRMLGGVPWVSLDENDKALAEMVCHMTQSLEGDAKWAKNLSDLADVDVVEALYEEVRGHEATFHGRRPAEGGRDPEGGDAGGEAMGNVEQQASS